MNNRNRPASPNRDAGDLPLTGAAATPPTYAMETYTVRTKRGPETFVSPLATTAAIDVCRKLGDAGNTFAADLCGKWDQWGLSPAQIAWVHKLAVEASAPPATPASGADASLVLCGVVAIFDTAAEHLQYPRVTFDIDSPKHGRARLVFSRCGSRSKTPGAVNVSDGEGYGVGQWYGRISRDGKFIAGNLSGNPGTLAKWALGEMATVGFGPFAARYGRKTCRCAFCNQALTDDRSTAVGYGPICARHYGLTWGETPETPALPEPAPALAEAPRDLPPATAEFIVSGELGNGAVAVMEAPGKVAAAIETMSNANRAAATAVFVEPKRRGRPRRKATPAPAEQVPEIRPADLRTDAAARLEARLMGKA